MTIWMRCTRGLDVRLPYSARLRLELFVICVHLLLRLCVCCLVCKYGVKCNSQ